MAADNLICSEGSTPLAAPVVFFIIWRGNFWGAAAQQLIDADWGLC
jgi:hypothetical protein